MGTHLTIMSPLLCLMHSLEEAADFLKVCYSLLLYLRSSIQSSQSSWGVVSMNQSHSPNEKMPTYHRARVPAQLSHFEVHTLSTRVETEKHTNKQGNK